MAVSLPAKGAHVCNRIVTNVELRAHRRARPLPDRREHHPARGAPPQTRPTGRRDAPRGAKAKQPVELHVISDSTGETAVRLVHALEAQFPDQPFEEIRHPRVETVDDLQLALNRAKGRPAVIIYTLVHPELREA